MTLIQRALARTGRRRDRAMVAAALAVVMAGAVAVASPAASGKPAGDTVTHQHACVAPTAGHAACLALIDSDAAGRPLSRNAVAAAGLQPFNAADLQSAYGLRSASGLLGGRQTIAIVDAYDDPNAQADLAVYRAANGLPECTADSGCFRKVDQNGGTDYPPTDPGWAVEISLDLDMASAVCPNCQLLLVESDDEGTDSLGAAVDQAAKLGANAISNSYGTPEWNGQADWGSHFDHPGIAVVAASGDWGFGVYAPAAFSTVVAVGGTTLYHDGSARGWGEKAWSYAGSGCSAYAAKPSWQKDRLCAKRAVADVSAVADPDTPVAVYDTFGSDGWLAVGGTSASSPLIAGIYALAGNTESISAVAYPYAHRGSLFDVTTGSNGACSAGYLCNAVSGYDGPTGNGTPNGIGAF
jgi:Subtilase family